MSGICSREVDPCKMYVIKADFAEAKRITTSKKLSWRDSRKKYFGG